jgi:hypothetical protein
VDIISLLILSSDATAASAKAASNRNDYQEYFLGVKAAGVLG